MEVRVTDLRGLDAVVRVPDPCTAGCVAAAVAAGAAYDTRGCALCHAGRVLDPDAALTAASLAGDRTLVLFSERAFPAKAFPAVDRALRLPGSRYDALFCDAIRPASSPFAPQAPPEPPAESDAAAFLRDALQLPDGGRRPQDFPALRGEQPAAPRASPLFSLDAMQWELIAAGGLGPAPSIDLALPGIGLSADHRAAVIRLAVATGIEIQTVVQVFCACDRNEAQAEGCLISMRT
jgi:hypothetical protein